MDKFMSLTQLIIAVIMFLCVIIEVVAHTIMGHITSPLGFFVAIVFLVLTWVLVTEAWKEYQGEKNK